MPWPQIQERIEQELGKPFSAVFSRIDPVPLATASVAQVHTVRCVQPILILESELLGCTFWFGFQGSGFRVSAFCTTNKLTFASKHPEDWKHDKLT